MLSLCLAALLLCLWQAPVMRPAAAAGTEQTAVACAAVENASVPPTTEDEGAAGFFKSILTRFLTMLKLLCMTLSGKTEPAAQEGRDGRLIADVQTDKARYAGCRGGKAYYVPEPSDYREYHTCAPIAPVEAYWLT